MSSFFGSILSTATQLGLAKPTGSEFALLVVLGAFLLALRTFREGYLKIWTVGWITFVASRLAGHVFVAQIPQRYVPVAEQAGFVLAVGLLAAAIVAYTRGRDFLVPLAVITPILMGFTVARLLLWPDSLPLRVALEVGYRIILLSASIALLRARRGRWELGAWLLALSLPLLHLSWPPFTDSIPTAVFVSAEMVLGLSMLLVVFDESRARNKRLAVMQAVTAGVVSAQQYGNMVQTALQELQRLTKTRAAWFRLL
jgi:hypothetical protein